MKRLFFTVLMTAALLTLCACGAAARAVPAASIPTVSAAPAETPSPEPTGAPTPAPSATPTPTPEPTGTPTSAVTAPLPSWEELQRTLYERDYCCAVLYLGRSSAPLSDALPELLAQQGLDGVSYLADTAFFDCVEHSGDEVFILIPRGDKTVSLYNYVFETSGAYNAYAGALLYASGDRSAVAVRCNESDVRTNLLAVISGLDGECRFSPRITLDDTFLPAPDVYALVPTL